MPRRSEISLDDAIRPLGRVDETGVSVVDRSDDTLAGWIPQRDILDLDRRRVAPGSGLRAWDHGVPAG